MKPLTSRQFAWRGLQAAAMVLVVALTGCSALSEPSPFVARVTVFQQWPADASGATYRFAKGSDTQNLEQRNYQDYLRVQLSQAGLVEAQPWQRDARFTVNFTTNSEAFQTWTEVPSSYPYFYGPPIVGLGYGHRFGWGYSMMVPFGGYGYQSVPVTAWRYTLVVSIRDQSQANAQVYQGTATHVGDGGPDELPFVVPYLAEALFLEFPQPNGESRTVRIRR